MPLSTSAIAWPKFTNWLTGFQSRDGEYVGEPKRAEFSGLAGVMSASRLYSAQCQLGIGYELDAIAAVIPGGTSFDVGLELSLGR